MAAIATRLGYSDPRSLRRAMHRWAPTETNRPDAPPPRAAADEVGEPWYPCTRHGDTESSPAGKGRNRGRRRYPLARWKLADPDRLQPL